MTRRPLIPTHHLEKDGLEGGFCSLTLYYSSNIHPKVFISVFLFFLELLMRFWVFMCLFGQHRSRTLKDVALLIHAPRSPLQDATVVRLRSAVPERWRSHHGAGAAAGHPAVTCGSDSGGHEPVLRVPERAGQLGGGGPVSEPIHGGRLRCVHVFPGNCSSCRRLVEFFLCGVSLVCLPDSSLLTTVSQLFSF